VIGLGGEPAAEEDGPAAAVPEAARAPRVRGWRGSAGAGFRPVRGWRLAKRP
jgi:hypothetical protein